jgi:hypothetical protein
MPAQNPFPGMNPYLESHWGDIHHSLVQYARDQLVDQLPDRFRARVEERVLLESDTGWGRNVYPDVRVIERPHRSNGGLSQVSSGMAVAEPLIIQRPSEEITEGYIEIRDAESGNRVVTVIEVLSRVNKAGGVGTRKYQEKQSELIDGGTSLVEIDLLRGGERVLAAAGFLDPLVARVPYLTCVTRGYENNHFELYTMPLRQRLPAVRIPLAEGVADVALDVQPLVDRAYRFGGYDDLDYDAAPIPPLDAEDTKWANQLLVEKGLRSNG